MVAADDDELKWFAAPYDDVPERSIRLVPPGRGGPPPDASRASWSPPLQILTAARDGRTLALAHAEDILIWDASARIASTS